ncbi:unnamed protein product [Kuraishia capsulata CBS 1993]|uniref:Uncharacterized protein n=1 Tax=Kuraishia capsulata CBS 1993 TaxID=1382522 RepID=W6MY12_9ASCO|nr:uncharacterized protein KUCA_T00005824001 [Kuraishia capsulata CBS 1993]CDK29830.1 unnamed protein product [Kuraishia capsulata CBS 1993]
MFGACISGYPVAVATEVEPLKYTIQFSGIRRNVSHFCLFLLPGVPFDPGYTALVYYQISSKVEDLSRPNEFTLFGGLMASKPSAIFKMSNPYASSGATDADMGMDMDFGDDANSVDITIGISIEPNAQAALALSKVSKPQSSALVPKSGSNITSPHELMVSTANKIIGKAYNYLSGFADNNNKVDISKFNEWWTRFISKYESDPNYLSRDG